MSLTQNRCTLWARHVLAHQEATPELVPFLDPVFRLAAVVGAAADAGDNGVVRTGFGRSDDGTGEQRADDRLEASGLADAKAAFRMHGGEAGRHPEAGRRTVDLGLGEDADI